MSSESQRPSLQPREEPKYLTLEADLTVVLSVSTRLLSAVLAAVEAASVVGVVVDTTLLAVVDTVEEDIIV